MNFGAADSARRSNERIREELHEWQNMVSAMQRRILNIDERLAALEGKPASGKG